MKENYEEQKNELIKFILSNFNSQEDSKGINFLEEENFPKVIKSVLLFSVKKELAHAHVKAFSQSFSCFFFLQKFSQSDKYKFLPYVCETNDFYKFVISKEPLEKPASEIQIDDELFVLVTDHKFDNLPEEKMDKKSKELIDKLQHQFRIDDLKRQKK